MLDAQLFDTGFGAVGRFQRCDQTPAFVAQRPLFVQRLAVAGRDETAVSGIDGQI